MRNGDIALEVLADVTGFEIVRPRIRKSTALGSALLAALGTSCWMKIIQIATSFVQVSLT